MGFISKPDLFTVDAEQRDLEGGEKQDSTNYTKICCREPCIWTLARQRGDFGAYWNPIFVPERKTQKTKKKEGFSGKCSPEFVGCGWDVAVDISLEESESISCAQEGMMLESYNTLFFVACRFQIEDCFQ